MLFLHFLVFVIWDETSLTKKMWSMKCLLHCDYQQLLVNYSCAKEKNGTGMYTVAV